MEKALALKPDDEGLILATAAAQLQSRTGNEPQDLTKPVFAKTHDPAAGMILLEAQLGAKREFSINARISSLKCSEHSGRTGDAATLGRIACLSQEYFRIH